MKLIRFADLVPGPWKNGGGETREIAVFPPGAGAGGFDWRLSMATVAAAGPFSAFPGIDRTLILLDGAGLRLQFEGEAARVIRPGMRVDFPGERGAWATPIDGPARDLNVMVRRDRCAAEVTEVSLPGEATRVALPAAGAIVVRTGRMVLPDGAGAAAGDTLLPEPGDAAEIIASGKAGLIVVRITRLGPEP